MVRRSMNALSTRRWPALLCIAVAGGCGGDGGSGAAVAMPATEACALLGADELAGILGADAGAAEAGVPADAKSDGASAVECRWATRDGARTLAVVLHRANTADDASAVMRAVEESFSSAGQAPAPIDSIGDDAFFAFNQLHVRSGTDHLTIVVTGFSNDAALEAATKAAGPAVTRLTADHRR